MATAGLYNLLILDDTNQDSYLVAQHKIKQRLLNIKKDKIKKIEDKIYEINKKLDELNKNSYTLVDNKEFENNKNEIIQLTKTLTHLKDNYTDYIKPKSSDIDLTHFLFINNHYKPFVEFSFEYLNSTINTKPLFGNSIEFTIPPDGEFISDMFIYLRLSELKPLEETDKVRYADFLGHKIFKNIQFIINNNVIDEYTSEYYNIHYFMHVSEDKKIGWLKCIGQEIPIEATLIQDPNNDNYKEKRLILNGYQTLKNNHSSLELYIPLLFWFNKDKRLALPNNISQYGKVKVRIELEEVNKLLQDNLNKYLVAEKLDILGNPLPKVTEDFNWDVEDYKFEFELGLAPEPLAVLAFVTCLATSPNSSLDFLVTPVLCIVDNVGSFSNIFKRRPTFTFIA